MKRMRRMLTLVSLLVVTPVFAQSQMSKVKTVFVIMLENESSSSTFGNPAADPYLASTLPSLGAFLPNYYAVGHASNDNYVAITGALGLTRAQVTALAANSVHASFADDAAIVGAVEAELAR